jgi:histidinol-phosphate aminotransferase
MNRPTLSRIVPYIPGKAIAEAMAEYGLTHVVKMASNENPLGPSVSWKDLQHAYKTIHVYPHQPACPLIHDLATMWDVSPLQVVLGNGSDEVILFLAQAFLNPDDEVLSSACTFSEYRFVSMLMDGQYKQVPLTPNYTHDTQGLLAAISPKTKLIFIANPNNPTGTILTHTELEAFLSQVPSHILVVIDEAYAEFTSSHDFPNSKKLLTKYKNLVILRTFSKLYGLAGLRVGYGVAHELVSEAMLKTRLPFNLNSLALEAGRLALQATDFVEKTLTLNKEGLHYLSTALTRLGLKTLPTQANFVCIFLPKPAKVVTEGLLKQGIIVRALDSFGLDHAIRVTVGLYEHNKAFIEGLKRVI